MNKIPDIDQVIPATTNPPPEPLLQAQSLGKTVPGPDGELILLEGIDFTLSPGQSVAITGPSGSGKSTLLGVLAGLDIPSSGQVLLDGHPFSQLDEDGRAVRRGELCAFVFQHFHLVNDLNAVENVMLPLELQGQANPQQTARHWLERVGLEHRFKHFPSTLSGGEQQRVALARAFAMQPRLLFADEPTGSLDHANGKRVSELLFDLNRETGTALVLVTHDEHLAMRCQRHLRLEDGHLFEDPSQSSQTSPAKLKALAGDGAQAPTNQTSSGNN